MLLYWVVRIICTIYRKYLIEWSRWKQRFKMVYISSWRWSQGDKTPGSWLPVQCSTHYIRGLPISHQSPWPKSTLSLHIPHNIRPKILHCTMQALKNTFTASPNSLLILIIIPLYPKWLVVIPTSTYLWTLLWVSVQAIQWKIVLYFWYIGKSWQQFQGKYEIQIWHFQFQFQKGKNSFKRPNYTLFFE